MGLNLKRVEFEGDATWTCPPGVTKVRVMSSGSQGRQVSISTTSAAIDATGAIYAWGNGFVGQTGNGTLGGGSSSPILVSGGKTWRQISTKDGSTSKGIDNAGLLFAWGGNPSGECGDGTVINRSTPVAVLGGLKWKQACDATSYSLGITNTGDLYAWGRNYLGILGQNSTAVAAYSSPIMVVGGLKWRKISGGIVHWAGITSDGSIYTCGVNSDGQLGDGTIISKSSPVLVVGGIKWKAVSAGTQTKSGCAAISEAGDLYTWGGGLPGAATSSPVMVVSTKKWTQVCHTGAQVFALTTEGDMYAFGANTNGLLGIGTSASVSTPTLVVGGLKWREISEMNASFITFGGITTDGNLWAWGFNGQGAVGDGTIIDRSSPVLVIGAKSWRAVSPTLENDLIVNVVPGQTYPVVLNADYSAFGSAQLTPANSPYGIHKITLEYCG